MPYIRKHAKQEIVNFLDVKTITKIIVLDVETNGLDNNCSVLSCSGIKYEINPETYEMTELDRFNRYYFPIEPFNQSATSVNGLTFNVITGKRENADYPQYFNQDSGFEKFCNDVHRFVAHNISFDKRFIPFLEGKKQFCTMMTNMDIVAVEFFEWKNEWKYPKLSETAIHYGIQFNESELHRSMSDTEITSIIFQKMIDAIRGNVDKVENIYVSPDYTYVNENTEKYMIDALKNTDGNKRSNAAEILGKIKSTNAVEPIIDIALLDEDYKSRWNAIEALGEIGDSKAIDSLIEITLKDKHFKYRWLAIVALGKIGDPRAIEPLISALSDNTLTVRKYAVNALKKFKEPMAIFAVRDYEETNRDNTNGTIKQSQKNLHEKPTNTEVNNNPSSEYNINNFDHLHKIVDTHWSNDSINLILKITHVGLGVSRVLRDDGVKVYERARDQFSEWDEKWIIISQKKKAQTDKEASIKIAEERTQDARVKIKQIEDLLIYAIDINNTVTLDSLKNTRKFIVPNPKYNSEGNLRDIYEISPPIQPTFRELPIEPNIRLYTPDISFIDNIFEYLKEKKIKQAETLYQEAITAWKKSVDEVNSFNSGIKVQYEQKIKEYEEKRQAIKKRYEKLEEDWKNSKELFYKIQTEKNDQIEKLKESYFSRSPEAVIEYFEIVLNKSKYPETFSKNFDLDYNQDNKLLIVDYFLPTPDDFPSLTEVKYISTKKEFKEYYLSEKQISQNYDSGIYKMTLRTLHEIFEADKAEGLGKVIFNGWVKSINKATGNRYNSCIISIQAKKAEFIKIELSNVDPKLCFQNLNGIGSNNLSSITKVQPIAKTNKNDKRFVSSDEGEK